MYKRQSYVAILVNVLLIMLRLYKNENKTDKQTIKTKLYKITTHPATSFNHTAASAV
jgi:hypothetical protein